MSKFGTVRDKYINGNGINGKIIKTLNTHKVNKLDSDQTMISFRLPIRLIPKKRPMVTKRVTYMPQDYLAQREYIQLKTRAFKSFGDQELTLRVKVVYKLSKTNSRNKMSMPMSDCDNLGGSIMDALEGICYENDRQIVDLHVIKEWGESDYVEVKLYQYKHML